MPRAASSRPDSELLDKNRPTGTHFSDSVFLKQSNPNSKVTLSSISLHNVSSPSNCGLRSGRPNRQAGLRASFTRVRRSAKHPHPIQPMRHFVISCIIVALEILDVLIPHQLSTLSKALKQPNLRFLIFSPAGTLNLRIATMSAQKITVARCAQLYLVGHLN